VLKPTPQELRRAAELGIENAHQMSGPKLREAIRRQETRSKPLDESNKWVVRCSAIGIQVSREGGAPTLRLLKRLYAARLPQALVERGIVENAVVRIPEDAGLTRSGVALVGKVHPMNSATEQVTITLQFEGTRAFAHDAWLVWRHAIVVSSPRSS
jgi:hypothetical protein